MPVKEAILFRTVVKNSILIEDVLFASPQPLKDGEIVAVSSIPVAATINARRFVVVDGEFWFERI